MDVQNPATHAVRLNFADHQPHNFRIFFVEEANNSQNTSVPRRSWTASLHKSFAILPVEVDIDVDILLYWY